MRRISLGSLVLFVALGAAACNKPSTESCRKAIANMRSIHGTDSPTTNRNIESDVRSCKGGSSKEAVECAIKATTVEELNACDFMKGPRHKGSGSDLGSGSAAGSATTGSADGSAADGSAAAGSAAPGSAAGGN